MEKIRPHAEFRPESCEKHRRGISGLSSMINEQIDDEKRVRREIANSNERRRMQSINAGFDSLRLLLPPIQDGEKLSKATILQLTAEYITTLVNRVNALESEVAMYRQSSGVQPSTVLPELPVSVSVTRKRRSDDQKKRPTGVRIRRRRVDTEPIFDNPRPDYVHCSPVGGAAHQASPSNSYNGSLSVSPTSPQPESTSSTSARLEHLVMAIEQIEGGRNVHTTPAHDSQDESFSAGDQSPPVPSEAYWQSPQENFHGYVYTDVQGSNLKSINPFTDVLLLNPTTDVNTVTVSSASESSSTHPHPEEYPVVAKILNRPIPHKYLHRPQVIVNSSH
ncbi:unnamed protein product [Calicophoron daubneyi]|uniref:BHLH domain-containing protein n=1 Tax=Calicophoron daubneyi TaxID=300641 RepID=A0AAV2T6N8_CALDB